MLHNSHIAQRERAVSWANFTAPLILSMEWTAPAAWDARFWERSPMLKFLEPAACSLGLPDWPTLADYNRLLDQAPAPILTRSGRLVRCVPQGPKPTAFEEEYESRIYLRGEVQTRTSNWHDLFNALAWRAFPETKAELNRQHYLAATAGSGHGAAQNRGTARDVLTLFDESGVAVVCADRELANLLRGRRWKELFWQRRNQIPERMKFFLFGHSLHEKALRPYIGLTGKGAVFPAEEGFLAQPLEDQLEMLDRQMAARFSDPASLRSTDDLCPVPLLGVPGWWPDNQREDFYDNTRYFRPPRPSSPASAATAPHNPAVTCANRA
jgi:hypothetical protein